MAIRIFSWKEVAPFEGKVVAFQTDSPLLNKEGYSLPSDQTLLFGFIREADNQELGYRILRVLKINAFASTIFLTDSFMPLSIREAKKKEIQQLVGAISNGQAKLDRILDKERAIQILQSNCPFPSFIEKSSIKKVSFR